MILHNVLFKYTVILGFMTLSFSAMAQVDTSRVPQGAIEEIDVVRDYKPILADAVKVRRSPDMTNVRAYQPKLAYSILDKKLDITTGTKQLDIREMPPARPDDLKHNYAKVGMGNYNTFLGEVYVNTGEDEALQLGGFAKYLSQKGTLEGQNFGQQAIGIFGRNVLESFTISGEAGYDGRGSRFYGYIDSLPDLNPDPEKQRFNEIYIRGELESNYDAKADNLLSYSVKADGYLFSNSFDARENSIALSGYLNKKINVFNVGANVSADFTSVKDNAYSIGNHIIRLNPYIRFQGDNYKITLGANFVAEPGDSTRTNLFPTGEIEFALVPEYIGLFGGVNGDVAKTSLRDLAKENPYLDQNVNIINAVERLHIYAGIKGNAGATFNYKVSAFYKKIEDMPFYNNTAVSPQKFEVIYDRGSDGTKVTGIEGELNLRVSETVSLGGKLNINDYNMASEAQAWFLPEIKLVANTRINISDKFFMDGEILFSGQTYGKAYDYPVDPSSSLPSPSRSVSLPAFADFSAGAEYRINNKIGVYARINNMLGNTYERYLFYPRLGRNFFAGVNYSF